MGMLTTDTAVVRASTRVYGILGYPVRHSVSPAMQTAAFRACGLDAVYLAFEVAPKDLLTALEGARALGLGGCNITIPHKYAAAKWCQRLSADAETTFAVNTIVFDGGEAVGHNTDKTGFVRALSLTLGSDGKGVRALILGAGGVARAVVAGLVQAGAASVAVAARDRLRAEAMVADVCGRLAMHNTPASAPGGPASGLAGSASAPASPSSAPGGPASAPTGAATCPVDIIAWTEEALVTACAEAELIVSCLPGEAAIPGLGSAGNLVPDAWPLGPSKRVFDVVYGSDTPLLRAAKLTGASFTDGLEMLVQQGAFAFELWTRRPAPVEVMRAAARTELTRRGAQGG